MIVNWPKWMPKYHNELTNFSLDNFIGFTHVNVDFPEINASRNVNVDISSAALDDKPPPTGTFVIITALNPGTSTIPAL